MKQTDEFKESVYRVVAQIPEGRVMTYGDVAAWAGAPGTAWQVGQVAHFGPQDLPWHRVVNIRGGLARGYPGGIELQRGALETDGVVVDEDYQVDIARLRWHPETLRDIREL